MGIVNLFKKKALHIHRVNLDWFTSEQGFRMVRIVADNDSVQWHFIYLSIAKQLGSSTINRHPSTFLSSFGYIGLPICAILGALVFVHTDVASLAGPGSSLWRPGEMPPYSKHWECVHEKWHKNVFGNISETFPHIFHILHAFSIE